jgi:hypothetical protein
MRIHTIKLNVPALKNLVADSHRVHTDDDWTIGHSLGSDSSPSEYQCFPPRCPRFAFLVASVIPRNQPFFVGLVLLLTTHAHQHRDREGSLFWDRKGWTERDRERERERPRKNPFTVKIKNTTTMTMTRPRSVEKNHNVVSRRNMISSPHPNHNDDQCIYTNIRDVIIQISKSGPDTHTHNRSWCQ